MTTKDEIAGIIDTLPPEAAAAVLDTARGLAVGRIRAEIINDWRLMAKLHQVAGPHDVVDLGMLHAAEGLRGDARGVEEFMELNS